MSTKDNACLVWDFRTSAELFDTRVLKDFLKTKCKKWVFQKEQGEGGYIHYQGRLSLIKRLREKPMTDWFMTLKEKYPGLSFYIGRTVTALKGKTGEFYVTKEETRLEGPWRDTDPEEEEQEIQMQEHISEIINEKGFKWKEWQQQVIDSFNIKDYRKINVVVDYTGNTGKSFLSNYLLCKRIAEWIPPLNDYKDLMRMVMNMPKTGGYIVDMPRAIPKKNLKGIYSALETVKNGIAFDDRYHFKRELFKVPIIWVFTNAVPENDWLSKDRWKLYKIANEKLVDFYPNTKIEFVLIPEVQECIWEPEDNKIALGGPVI